MPGLPSQLPAGRLVSCSRAGLGGWAAVQRSSPRPPTHPRLPVPATACPQVGRLTKGLWLVWEYEGDKTLAYYLKR